jgi:hypothetical protein
MKISRSAVVRLSKSSWLRGGSVSHEPSSHHSQSQPHYHSDENTGYLFGVKVIYEQVHSNDILLLLIEALSQMEGFFLTVIERREISKRRLGRDLLLWFFGRYCFCYYRLESETEN